MAAPSARKVEYDKYMDVNGGKQMLGQAVVGLSKAALRDANVQPAAFLRDFFATGKSSGSAASAELSEADRQKVGEFMKTSGAYDLLIKALVALFDAPDRPPNPGVHFQDFFLKEAPQPSPPPPAAATEEPDATAVEPKPSSEAAAAEPPPKAPDAAAAEPPPSAPASDGGTERIEGEAEGAGGEDVANGGVAGTEGDVGEGGDGGDAAEGGS